MAKKKDDSKNILEKRRGEGGGAKEGTNQKVPSISRGAVVIPVQWNRLSKEPCFDMGFEISWTPEFGYCLATFIQLELAE